MKKKVAIVTITQGTNYGNRLQNFALQYALERMGLEVETLRNQPAPRAGVVPQLKRGLKRSLKALMVGTDHHYLLKREQSFETFNHKYMKWSKFYVTNHHIPEDLVASYDAFVAGSDQIWNPEFAENGIVNFLDFAPVEKKIAYAASFGTDHVPKEREEEIKAYLASYPVDQLSVREYAGASIIEGLCEKQAQVVTDPVMLLSKQDWREALHLEPIREEPPYLLAYFLGEVTEAYHKQIRILSEKNRLRIKWLRGSNERSDPKIGPREWLQLIMNASMVCTDSFHGTVFSMISEVPFVIYSRQDHHLSMNSRMETLAKDYPIGAYFSDQLKIDSISQFNQEEIVNKIQSKKEQSVNFLQKALKTEA